MSMKTIPRGKAERDFYNPDFPPYLTIDDALKAAPFLTRATLAALRHRERGPEFVKPSWKTVGYPNAAFFKWLNDMTVRTDSRRPKDSRPATKAKTKKEASR